MGGLDKVSLVWLRQKFPCVELEDLGALLQSPDGVSNGDKELEELGENLLRLEGVADGARSLEHGGDLGELKDNERAPDSRLLVCFQNCLSITGAPCASLARSKLMQQNHEGTCKSSRRNTSSEEAGDRCGNLKNTAQAWRASR